VTENNSSRRKFISTIGSASIFSISGCISKSTIRELNSIHPYVTPIKHNTINISLFQTDVVSKINKISRFDSNYSLKICKKYIKHELEKLGDSLKINVNINTQEIPQEIIAEDNYSDVMNKWIEYYSKNIDDENKSRDSNILLSSLEDLPSKGVGEYPCSCRMRNNLGISFTAGNIFKSTESTYLYRDSYNLEDLAISVVLHEIGHNLGFKHDMGYAWYDDINKCIKTTPMLSNYIKEPEFYGKTNHFGKQIVDINDYDVPIIYVPSLNESISHKNVDYELF